jgi:hypothetical protein
VVEDWVYSDTFDGEVNSDPDGSDVELPEIPTHQESMKYWEHAVHLTGYMKSAHELRERTRFI